MSRALAVLTCAVLVAALGAKHHAGAATAAPCRIGQLTLTIGPEIQPRAGHYALTLRLVSRSPSACLIDGFPTLALRDRLGTIPFVIGHTGDHIVADRRPRSVVVEPGRAAFVVVGHYRCDRGERSGMRTARTVSLALTASGRQSPRVSLDGSPLRALHYCGKGDPGSTLNVSPFVRTVFSALRH
jgi:hypothetical protein